MQLRWGRVRKFTEEVGDGGAAAREGWEMTGDLDEVDEVSSKMAGKLWTVLTKCLSRLMEEV